MAAAPRGCWWGGGSSVPLELLAVRLKRVRGTQVSSPEGLGDEETLTPKANSPYAGALGGPSEFPLLLCRFLLAFCRLADTD